MTERIVVQAKDTLGEIDLILADLEVIPHLIVHAMETGDLETLKGFQAWGKFMSPLLNPPVRLLQCIVEAKRRGETVLYDDVIGQVTSVNARFYLQDFVDWQLLTISQDSLGVPRFTIPDSWSQIMIMTDENPEPEAVLQPLGQILGLCSLAKHRDAWPNKKTGITAYIALKALLNLAVSSNGRVPLDKARDEFSRNRGAEGTRRWNELFYNDQTSRKDMRLFYGVEGADLIFNQPPLKAFSLTQERSRELFLERYGT